MRCRNWYHYRTAYATRWDLLRRETRSVVTHTSITQLCYNENEKKMEFVRREFVPRLNYSSTADPVLLPVDNPGLPTLSDGEPLYEVVRDDEGDGWQIREARVPTVLPPWQNVTMRPWYR